MKRWLPLLLVGLVIIGTCVVTGRSAPPKPNEVRDYMRAKLEHSQKVLEGLTLENFDLIAKNAQAMDLLSRATNWQVLQTQEYLQRSQDFQRTAEALTDSAKKKNLDGAALAYVELTMQCINCHKYVRETRSPKTTSPDTK
jgi:cytochrome c556